MNYWRTDTCENISCIPGKCSSCQWIKTKLGRRQYFGANYVSTACPHYLLMRWITMQALWEEASCPIPIKEKVWLIQNHKNSQKILQNRRILLLDWNASLVCYVANYYLLQKGFSDVPELAFSKCVKCANSIVYAVKLMRQLRTNSGKKPFSFIIDSPYCTGLTDCPSWNWEPGSAEPTFWVFIEKIDVFGPWPATRGTT